MNFMKYDINVYSSPILVSLCSLFASSSASLVHLASTFILISLCSCSLSLCIISEADRGGGVDGVASHLEYRILWE